MFQKVSAQELFPSTLWVHDLEPELAGPLNRRLAQELDRLTRPRPPRPPGDTWQTEQTLHLRPEFAELIGIFRAASSGVLERLEVDCSGFELTGCWANLNPRGGVHPSHNHPNNYLSGVYYVAAPAGADQIQFHEPRPQVTLIAPPVRRPNRYNSPIANVRVQAGRLILFPAWLVHSVEANPSDELRISISFNIIFSNYAQEIARPKWTGMALSDPPGTAS